MVIFHSYVSLPEGRSWFNPIYVAQCFPSFSTPSANAQVTPYLQAAGELLPETHHRLRMTWDNLTISGDSKVVPSGKPYKKLLKIAIYS